MQLMGRSRGQTIIEFVIAMPIALFALFAIVYLSHYSVLNERAELALRYGGIAAFDLQSGAYSASNIYSSLNGGSLTCPSPPPGILVGGDPMPGATTAPFWQPNSDVPQSTNCAPGAMGFGGSQFIASHFWAVTNLSVSAGIDVPPYVQGALGSSTASTTTQATFVHAAYPGIILWCSKEVRDRVYSAITAAGSSIPPTPIPDGAPAPSPPPNNNGSCN